MKVKIQESVIANLDFILLDVMAKQLEQCTNIEHKKELANYFHSLNADFVKILMRNVSTMTEEEKLARGPPVRDPIDLNFEKRTIELDVQIATISKRILLFREKYPKQLDGYFDKQSTQLAELDMIKEEMKLSEEITEMPSVKETNIGDAMSSALKEMHTLLQTLPNTSEQVLLIKEVEKKKRESPVKSSPSGKRKK